MKSKDQASYDNFVLCFNEFNVQYSSLYDSYLVDMKGKLFLDSISFFNFINVKRKDDGYPSTLKYLDTSTNDPALIADLFASFFENVFDHDDFTPSEAAFSHIRDKGNSNCFIPDITEDVVFDELFALSEDYCFGPDKIPSALLRIVPGHSLYP